MKQTENYGFEKPDIKEFFKLETWKNNMDKIDEAIKERETAQGVTDEEIKKIKNVQFTQADERKNIESKETLPVLFGKIARWIADLKTVAFSGSYNDLSNKPTIPTVANNNTTTEAGYALDARQANPNVEGSLGAQISALNSGLVNLQTVPEKYKDVAQHFINNIYPALSSDTQNIHSGVFAQNGYIGYSGVKAQSNYASFILHGYNYPALHLVCNDSQWLSLLLDNYNW